MTAESVYWMSVLANICDGVLGFSTFGVVWVICAVVARLSGFGVKEYPFLAWRYTVAIALFTAVALIFVPSGRVVWATYVIPHVSGSIHALKNLPEDVIKDLK